MKKLLSRSLAVGAAGLLAAAVSSSAVSAQAAKPSTTMTAKPVTYQVNLRSLNNSGASGSAVVTVDGRNVTVDMKAAGLSPLLAHAQHIRVGGQAACPTPAADADKDGVVSAKESESAVGAIRVSLTTAGDVSASSALAVDRMPKADAKGNLSYKRSFVLPTGVNATDLSKATVEVHGISTLSDNKTAYDGAKKSELDAKLPFEATAPAACGKLSSSPNGGANTGFGSTDGIEAPVALAFGTAAIIGAALIVVLGRRPLNSRQ